MIGTTRPPVGGAPTVTAATAETAPQTTIRAPIPPRPAGFPAPAPIDMTGYLKGSAIRGTRLFADYLFGSIYAGETVFVRYLGLRNGDRIADVLIGRKEGRFVIRHDKRWGPTEYRVYTPNGRYLWVYLPEALWDHGGA